MPNQTVYNQKSTKFTKRYSNLIILNDLNLLEVTLSQIVFVEHPPPNVTNTKITDSYKPECQTCLHFIYRKILEHTTLVQQLSDEILANNSVRFLMFSQFDTTAFQSGCQRL